VDFAYLLIAISASAAALCVFVMWSSQSRLAQLDARCDAAAADIDVQLKHRHSLIPNLAETVRSFAGHERSIIDAVLTANKTAAIAASPQASFKAEQALTVSINKLMSAAARFPNIQADEHYRRLAMEIADAENKIAATRRFLNSAVKEYNAVLMQFPADKVAIRMGLGKRNFYDLGVERLFLDDAPALKL
jgi:LemA protein